ncbi:alpha-amylase family glycosyl hydrolase [Thermomicrobiaceae bacterium CFH 74404]|uniref:Alpha-amylase family glycosyl hydrolase n=1 Tax=Thermalbibacter longus TaxID=2951981 RepID=A0AA42BA96_9BACT|nr:alpha-amylase family glycosyl hydrolase [Thermalbibacter longus]MCM8748260.1 alpha-amylase family glycosyl hydrolase [Thermalbibacter longus]
MSAEQYLWWQRGVIYQIYPRSFMDGNDDGIGDLPGILSRLDYLEWLGVDAIWLSPIFPSPMADFGYDVSDYVGIDPVFGTMEDFDRLVREAHARGIRVLLDFVANHTSDQHPWFLESRSSRQSPKRDWYIWRDAAPGGGPPNNWLSAFGGSAWEWDAETGQYYFHAFLKEQPDLNWRNPDVQRAMLDAMRFWFDRGVDGFRLDAIWHLIKDGQFRDNPPNPDYKPTDSPYHRLLPVFTTDRPEIHPVLAMMRRLADEYDERVLIGEIYLPVERLVTYYGLSEPELHLPYNFQLLLLPWDARRIQATIDVYEALLPSGAWPNWVLGNHDRPRIASRVGRAQARVATMLLLTLRGTPTIYYGDEIGMVNVEIPPEAIQDPVERTAGRGFGRDPERTPMQWDSVPNAGFTLGQPWLPLSPDYPTCNVEAQRDDPRSILTLHRRLLALRRAEPALSIGSYRSLPAEGELIAYLREDGERRFLIVLNFGHWVRRYACGQIDLRGSVVLSTYLDREGEMVDRDLLLRPDEGVIIGLTG